MTCLCASFGVAFLAEVTSLAQQISASNPVIGVEIDDTGRIVQPVHEVSSKASVIYFGFDYAIPQGREMSVTVDWYIDGHLAYSVEKTLRQGPVVFAIDRKDVQFSKGNYQVVAHLGEIYLTSAEFVVK